MSPELDGMSVRRIGELVDRLMANGNRMALQPHPAGDLLRRPAMHDPLDDRLADMREAYKLPEFGPALAGHVMRGHAMIAAQFRPLLVDVDVTPDLTENRRAMASKFLRDYVNAQAGVTPSGDPAAFVQVYVGIGAFHGSVLAADNPLASFASRTSNLNPPRLQVKNRVIYLMELAGNSLGCCLSRTARLNRLVALKHRLAPTTVGPPSSSTARSTGGST